MSAPRGMIGLLLAASGCVGMLGCATTVDTPGVSFSNTDRSTERRAEAACRTDAGVGAGAADAGATAAYHACMARYRRPADED